MLTYSIFCTQAYDLLTLWRYQKHCRFVASLLHSVDGGHPLVYFAIRSIQIRYIISKSISYFKERKIILCIFLIRGKYVDRISRSAIIVKSINLRVQNPSRLKTVDCRSRIERLVDLVTNCIEEPLLR